LKSLLPSMIIVLFLLFFNSCAATSKGIPVRASSLSIVDISEGLPQDGLWRQNLALVDMNGEGLLDILAPPTRRPKEGEGIPHIFLQQEGNKWKRSEYRFPNLKGYGYGGIAADDLNNDGRQDIALAVHSGKILLLMNNNDEFSEVSFSVMDNFHSRAIEISDINGDGWKDIISLSEATFGESYKPGGILIGINNGGKGWNISIVKGSEDQFGDYMALGDINGDGKKDILIAPQTHRVKMKPLWFGDGMGQFEAYNGDLFMRDMDVYLARCGDVDGDGKDEAVFKIAGLGVLAKERILVLRWKGDVFEDISKGLESIEKQIAFDLEDVDRDGKKEIVILSDKGIEIYGYTLTGWMKKDNYNLSDPERSGVYDLRVRRDRDGSSIIVYNQGGENPAFKHGIRAFRVR